MGIKVISFFDTRFDFFKKESFHRIVYRNMALFISFCWFYLTNCFFFLIKFIARYVFRIKMDNNISQKAIEDYSEPLEPVSEANEIEGRIFNGFYKEEEEEPSNFSFKFEYQIPNISTESNEEVSVPTTKENYQARTTNISNYRFSSEKDVCGFFEESKASTFQVHESFIDANEENLGFKFLSSRDFVKPVISSNRFLPKKDFRGFVEESKAMNIQVNESFVDRSEEKTESEFLVARVFEKPTINNFQFMPENDFSMFLEKLASQINESSINSNEENLDFWKPMFVKNEKVEGKKPIGFETDSIGGNEAIGSFSGFDSDSDSKSLSDGYSVKNLVIDSESDGFLSERDFVGDKESLIDSSTFKVELMENLEKLEECQSSNSSNRFSDMFNLTNCGNIFDGFFSERVFNGIKKISEEKLDELQSLSAENYPSYIDKLSQLDEIWSENESLELELKELNEGEIEGTELPSSSNVEIEFMDSSDDEIPHASNFSNDFNEKFDLSAECNDSNGDHLNSIDNSNHFNKVLKAEEKCEETKSKDLDAKDVDELESLWEHQDFIEQLKMELKRGRNIGLPTIFEESESPKTIEDLKPWKIDEKFLHEDPIDERHKFYKSYRERMRKFDILNYQKMYTIGFLRLKNPLESMVTNKPLIPTIISHLSRNLRQKSSTNPSEKFMKELQVDLETVYVGQTCLSWEFLRWQYEKAREISDSDPYRSPQYNQVAGEFQQFQVILQRFVENETFQGPRLQNYVQNRCVLRNLLQVPLIKEDCLKDKMEERRKGNNVITRKMLEKIMKDSIGIFWEFVKADKDENSIILKGLIRNQVELQDPSDFELMTDIQASLDKKEKKLKDILKTGNCLVKKFKKPRDADQSNQDLFFSQIDIKLVSRALKMSRITSDQLVWCHNKLSKITFADRKIHREPSFLLFPC